MSDKFLVLESRFVWIPTRIYNLVRVKVIGDSVDSFRVLKEACDLIRLEKAYNTMLSLDMDLTFLFVPSKKHGLDKITGLFNLSW